MDSSQTPAPDQPQSDTPTPQQYNWQPVTAPTAQTEAALQSLAVWPGAFGAFRQSLLAIAQNLGTYLVVILLSLLLGGIVNISLHILIPQNGLSATGGNTALSLILALFGLQLLIMLIAFYAQMALHTIYLFGARGKGISPATALLYTLRRLLPLLGYYFIAGATLMASFIFFVVPGIVVLLYVLPKWSLAQYYILDPETKMDTFAAMSASWRATTGNMGKVWGIIGVTILCLIAAVLIIGIPLAMLYSAAFAVLYVFVRQQKLTGATSDLR